VRAWSLLYDYTGIHYAPSDAIATHVNTYSVIAAAAARGECWTCLVDTTPVDMR